MFFVRILFFCDFWLVRFMKKVKVLLHVPTPSKIDFFRRRPQLIPQTIYLSILSEIKNMVITALCELEKNHGNLDKLGIDISKKKKVQIESENNDINRAVFNISITGESDTKKEKWYSKVA